MSLVYIGLGSNLGDRHGNILTALELLKVAGIKVDKVASFIETSPYGEVEQPNFINTVCSAETALLPQELLKLLKKIEEKMGRVETVRWGPRVIDLDILLYDNLIIGEENLTIPHADMLNRRFVLEPLIEIAPDLVHPTNGIRMSNQSIYAKEEKSCK